MTAHLEQGDSLELVSGPLRVSGDFTRMLPRLKPHNLQRELLVKAARIKVREPDAPLRAVDATAGLGEDALLLAAAGFSVDLFERNATIAALLKDALRRGAQHPGLAEFVGRMNVVEGDSREGLRALGYEPDVVLLDPMFPAKRKDAAAKKKLQLLQELEQPCDDEEALLEAAIAANPRKVIVKRPIKGPYLAGRKLDYSLTGKAIRYDCLVLRTAE